MSELKEEFNKALFRVAIFGSARIADRDPVYKLVFNLARLIAGAGKDVVTSGGTGLMDAASKGHFKGQKDSRLNSMGLNIKLPHEQSEAVHLYIKKDFEHFSHRRDHFMVLSKAFVITPGGIGTLLELLYTWQRTKVRQISSTAIILRGKMWSGLIGWIKSWPLGDKLLDPEDLALPYITRNCDEAFTVIQNAYEDYRKGGRERVLPHLSPGQDSLNTHGISMRSSLKMRGPTEIRLRDFGRLLFLCLSLCVLACHLAGLTHSGSYSHFREHVPHDKIPSGKKYYD